MRRSGMFVDYLGRNYVRKWQEYVAEINPFENTNGELPSIAKVSSPTTHSNAIEHNANSYRNNPSRLSMF
jgi:hypothetical protein